MKKNPKVINLLLILAILLSTVFFTKVECYAFAFSKPAAQSAVNEKDFNKKDLNPVTIPEKNAYALAHMKQDGFKSPIFKFVLAMLGVLLSSLAIFLGLKIYKKFILKNNEKFDNIDYNKNLESPKDFKEAINLFLDKTNR